MAISETINSLDYIFTFLSLSHHCKALNSLICADVPLRNYSFTQPEGRPGIRIDLYIDRVFRQTVTSRIPDHPKGDRVFG